MTSRHTIARVSLAISTLALLATPAVSQLVANPLGGPQAGMVCRSGYTGALSSGAFRCTRIQYHTVNLACPAGFSNYAVRAASSPNNPDGRDLCARNNVTIPSTGPLGGLTLNQDYKLAEVDSNALGTELERLRDAEARGLGLESGGVAFTSSGPVIAPDGGNGSRDRATVQVTFYTFAVKTGPQVAAAARN